MPVNVRVKGKKWERAVAVKLRPLFGSGVKRGYQTRDGREAPDVDGTPYWIECKHGVNINLHAALAQAVRASDGRPPVVVAKYQNRAPMVAMLLTDWLQLVERELPRLVAAGLKEIGHGEEDGSAPPDGDAEEAEEG